MAKDKIDRNDQAANRTDGNAPGTWPGSGTTVEGHVDTATSGILGHGHSGTGTGTSSNSDADAAPGSASTSSPQQEPDDRRAERT